MLPHQPSLQAVAIARRLLEEDSLELFVQPAFRDRCAAAALCGGIASRTAPNAQQGGWTFWDCPQACTASAAAQPPPRQACCCIAISVPFHCPCRSMANSLALYVTSKSKRATEGLIQNVR